MLFDADEVLHAPTNIIIHTEELVIVLQTSHFFEKYTSSEEEGETSLDGSLSQCFSLHYEYIAANVTRGVC